MMGPREGDVETGNVCGTGEYQTDEVVFCVGSIVRNVKEGAQQDIDHDGDILIFGLPLDQDKIFLCRFERGGDVFRRYGLKRCVGMSTMEKN